MDQKDLERFLKKIKFGNDGVCWEWQAATMKGYGWFKLDKRPILAHRVVYEIVHGIIPQGLEIDHTCRNRKCCNPNHLEAVSHKVNVLRGASPVAQRARQIFCKRGHLLDSNNIRMTRAGGRQCLICKKKVDGEYYRKNKAERAARPPETKQPSILDIFRDSEEGSRNETP